MISTVRYVDLAAIGWLAEDVEAIAEELNVTFGDLDVSLVSLRTFVGVLKRKHTASPYAKMSQQIIDLAATPEGEHLFVNLKGCW